MRLKAWSSYLHGNAGALDSWGKIANISIPTLGYDIFMLDYRGFGKSEGEIEDSQQVLKDVSNVAYQNISSKGYSQKNKIVLGYSIGHWSCRLFGIKVYHLKPTDSYWLRIIILVELTPRNAYHSFLIFLKKFDFRN